MQLFGISDASYFCNGFAPIQGDATGSLAAFQRKYLTSANRTLSEGSPLFNSHRACMLREVERCLFLSVSQYRRALDLMIASASPWAHVTLYYGGWYAAHAILGMFGCTILDSTWVVDVRRRTPGSQEMRRRRIGNKAGQEPTTCKGSHRIFWELFYRAVTPLRPQVLPKIAAVLSPVANDPAWLIAHRNDANYDTFRGLRLVNDFQRSFSTQHFPGSLPGVLGTQWRVSEGLLGLGFLFAHQLGLQTDALSSLGSYSSFRQAVAKLIYEVRAQGLVRKTIKAQLV